MSGCDRSRPEGDRELALAILEIVSGASRLANLFKARGEHPLSAGTADELRTDRGDDGEDA